jgi:hypothetical protein
MKNNRLLDNYDPHLPWSFTPVTTPYDLKSEEKYSEICIQKQRVLLRLNYDT